MEYLIVALIIFVIYMLYRDKPSSAFLNRNNHTGKQDLEPDPVLPVRLGRSLESLRYAPIDRCKATVFLDIDGVCHKYFDESLDKIPLLETFLAENDVQIVISSTWRETCNEGYLSKALGEIVWQRVVGFTPKLDVPSGVCQRQAEVEEFACYFGLIHYIALDDDKSEFDEDAKVYFVDRRTGLLSKDLGELTHWFRNLGLG